MCQVIRWTSFISDCEVQLITTLECKCVCMCLVCACVCADMCDCDVYGYVCVHMCLCGGFNWWGVFKSMVCIIKNTEIWFHYWNEL